MTRRRTVFVMILLGLALSLGGCYDLDPAEPADGGDSDADSESGTDTDGDTDTCADVGMYGPQPCTSDDQCEDEYGEGWWCDEDYVVEYDGCELVWPTCVTDISYYGPVPCDAAAGDGDGDEAGAWYGGETGV